MKKYLVLSIVILISQLISAQIPNGNFESWTQEFNYEIPTGWETNQDTFYARIQKDTLRVEGDYSLKLRSDAQSAFFDCTAAMNMSTKFDEPIIEEHNISFYLKLTSQNPEFPYFEFITIYYENGILAGQDIFIANQNYDEFTKIEMADIPIGTDSLRINIFSGALNGADDGCYNSTTSWVDDLKITDKTTANKNLSNRKIDIYPNPSSGIFNIRQESIEFTNYRVINIIGSEIQKGTLENGSIQISKAGPYILQLYSSKGREFDVVRKVIVE